MAGRHPILHWEAHVAQLESKALFKAGSEAERR